METSDTKTKDEAIKQLQDFEKTVSIGNKEIIDGISFLTDKFRPLDRREITVNGRKVVLEITVGGIVLLACTDMMDAQEIFNSLVDKYK